MERELGNAPSKDVLKTYKRQADVILTEQSEQSALILDVIAMHTSKVGSAIYTLI